MKPENVEEFQNEITMMSKIEDPTVIKVYATYEDNSRYYIVTDLYKGGDLFDGIINREKFIESDAINVAQQILRAVNVCHTKNVMHRDLKPENIMMDPEEKDGSQRIFLVDFGTGMFFKKNELVK